MSDFTDYRDHPIIVWPFAYAPENLRALTQRMGSHGWIAIVPPAYHATYVHWLASIGCCGVEEFPSPDRGEEGWMVYVGCHDE